MYKCSIQIFMLPSCPLTYQVSPTYNCLGQNFTDLMFRSYSSRHKIKGPPRTRGLNVQPQPYNENMHQIYHNPPKKLIPIPWILIPWTCLLPSTRSGNPESCDHHYSCHSLGFLCFTKPRWFQKTTFLLHWFFDTVQWLDCTWGIDTKGYQFG